jgi:tetratricopeptide (TPR) repeat protein
MAMRFRSAPTFLAALVALAALCSITPQRLQAGIGDAPKSQINYYLLKYGKADPDKYPQVRRAHRVFERVRAVADKRGARRPRLSIVNSNGDPWALALPDGHIVLSTRSVKICYQDVDLERGDARMAFVLGHELGHMAEDDFWHLETYRALTGDAQYSGLKKILRGGSDVPDADLKLQLAMARGKEIRADDRGFMYAGIAGFRVDTLLGGSNKDKDFFTYWMEQLPQNIIDTKHPTPDDRAGFLRHRLRALAIKLDFFKYAVRLAHFGRHDEAVYFFREFMKVFPSREVHNNLGFCLLQQAMAKMPRSMAYRYWLPTVLDLHTRANDLPVRGSRSESDLLSAAARELLQEASAHFKQACEADAAYWPSRLNLAIAQFYLGQMYAARAAVEQARRLAPGNSDILAMRTLILLHEDPSVDMWPTAVKLLEEIAGQHPDHLCSLYNLAVLFEKRGRAGKAKKIWLQLASIADSLPPLMRKAVAKRVKHVKPDHICDRSFEKPRWPLPLKIGTDFYENEKAEKLIAHWQKTPFNWLRQDLQGRILNGPDGAGALEIDGIVEMVVLRHPDLGSAETLKKRFGKALQIQKTPNAILLNHCNHWCAVAYEDRLAEIWVAIQ